MNKSRLPGAQRWAIYGVGLALGLTGAVWVCITEPAGNPWAALAMKAHGAAAMAFLVLFGSLLNHVLAGWDAKRNRASGAFLFSLLAFLALSGWALYYLGDERLRHFASLAHWILGFGLFALLAAHITLGRRTRKTRGSKV